MHVIQSQTKDVIVDAAKGSVAVNEVSETVVRFSRNMLEYVTHDQLNLFGPQGDMTLINNADYIGDAILRNQMHVLKFLMLYNIQKNLLKWLNKKWNT